MFKKPLPTVIALFFFFSLGFAAGLLVKNPPFSFSTPSTIPALEKSSSKKEPNSPQITSGNLPSSTSQTTNQNQTQKTYPKTPVTGKYTIVATTPLIADRARVETGEQVNFNITLKNEGAKKKFLTRICFNHSGGDSFGCLLNKNLFPGESFNLNNGMIFTSPGRYTVSVSWSQDSVNFYPPLNSNTVTITVE